MMLYYNEIIAIFNFGIIRYIYVKSSLICTSQRPLLLGFHIHILNSLIHSTFSLSLLSDIFQSQCHIHNLS